MVRPADWLIVPALVLAAPAMAQERSAKLDIAPASAGEVMRQFARQARVSIGFRDAAIGRLRVKGLRGRYTPARALERILAGSGARARQVAPGSYLIERAPPPVRVARPPPRPRPTPARPPEAEPDIGDIIVTASKRDVPLESYAGSAQIIDGASVTVAEGVRGTGMIEARAASVTSTHLGTGRNKLFIRGIADSSFVGPTQATVGQYWGNSRITYSAPDPSLRLYDVESIEVLEGPQGTLYGAGSLGGVVRVVPRAPDLAEASGQTWAGAQAVQHGDAGGDGGAILNLPIAENRVGLRVLGFGQIDGGYIDDRMRGLDDVNRVTTYGARAALRIAPDDDWTIDITGLGQRITGDDSQYADRLTDGLSRASEIAQPYRNEYWLGDIVVSRSFGAIEWTSSVGYARQHVNEIFEGPTLTDPFRPAVAPARDALPTGFSQDNRIEMFMAETRLARRGADGTGWLAAASLLRNNARVTRQMGVMQDFAAALTGVSNEVEEVTLYGEYALAPLPRTTLTLGARYTRSHLSGQSEDVAIFTALRMDPTADNARTESRLLPSAALVYRLGDHTTVFARYQEGFRPGGIAVRQDFIQQFDGDRVATSEAGVRFGNSAVDASLTFSWSRWRNIQADLVDGYGFPTTANIGDGRVLSVGWSGRWRPLAGLEFDAALYLNDSRLVETIETSLASLTGTIDQRRLPNVADTSGRVGFAYIGDIGTDTQIELRGYARYIGQSTLGIGAILGRAQGDYVDTGIDMRIGDDRRGLSLSLTNLLDSRGNRFALGSPFLIRDADHTTPLQPRSIRIGFDVAF